MLRADSGSHANSHFPSSQGERGSYQTSNSNGTSFARPRHHVAGSSPPTHTQRHAHHAHLPIQEYHSAFADAAFSPTRASHRRQQSFPNLLPFALRARSTSPERRQGRPSTPEEMPLTGDGSRLVRNSDSPKGGGLAGWLSSTSGNLYRAEGAAPSGRSSTSVAGDATPYSSPTKQKTTMSPSSAASTPKGSTPATSRFASLASSMTATLSKLTQTPTSPTLDDELLNLNVEAALFPSGSPSDRDVFSPSAFKNLQGNAVSLLTRMQNAYRHRSLALHEAESERLAQKDELEEATTRAENFRMQLEGMALKAAQQEKDMKALVDELAAERKTRAHERMMREKGVAALAIPREHPMSEASMISEDLGVEEERLKRNWRKSLKSDGSFDTDDESVEDESVFSRSRSPTIAATPFEGSVIDGPVSHKRVAALGQASARQKQLPMNAFQKLVKNVTSALKEEEENYAGPGCRNCQGRDARFAWDTVSLLRDENKQLKQRVGVLETEVDASLDIISGFGPVLG